MTALQRLLEKCVVENNGCWYFFGAKDPKGYGCFWLNGKQTSSHRASWELHKGPLTTELVLHSCDNPACCNPDHLFLGSQQDNMTDMITKNRNVSRTGANNGFAILTEDNVHTIKLLILQRVSNKEIARRFNIAQNTVSSIKHGKRWSHVA